jgi:protein gp37
MGETTNILWCHSTFNCWIGCAHARYTDKDGKEHTHNGCISCYAEYDMAHRRKRVIWGSHGTRSVTSPDYWKQPLRWNRDAQELGERRRVFCASLADVFEDWQGRIIDSKKRPLLINSGQGANGAIYPEGVPVEDDWGCRPLTMDDLRERLFYLIQCTPHLDWLLLTKRPQNIRRMWAKPVKYFKNVWLGASASDQESLDAVAPHLILNRDLCSVVFLSLEPLLKPVRLGAFIHKLDWVIAGGESDQIFPARPCDPMWLNYIIEQCAAASRPCFIKQLGSNPVGLKLKDSHGGDFSDFPELLKVRQFPQGIA